MLNKDEPTSEKFETNEHQRLQARELNRARTRLIVCFWTLPVYIVAVWILLNNQQNIETFMFIYMGIWAMFAVDMARRNCPLCHKQFFVKNILLRLRKKTCAHCGFPLSHVEQARGKDGDKDKLTF